MSFALLIACSACGERLAAATLLSTVELNRPATRAPKMAMASTPAILETALLMPDVTPTRFSATEFNAVAVSGATVADIAGKLFLSEGTVRNYLSAAIAKTGVRNRVEAVRVADERGWL